MTAKDKLNTTNGSDDDECWIIATQVEKEVIERDLLSQKENQCLNYSNFKENKPITSTLKTTTSTLKPNRFSQSLNFVESQVATVLPTPSQAFRNDGIDINAPTTQNQILQNKCNALQRQLKNLLSQQQKQNSSQQTESLKLNELKRKLQAIEQENAELRNNQFAGLNQQRLIKSEEVEKLKSELKQKERLEQEILVLKQKLALKANTEPMLIDRVHINNRSWKIISSDFCEHSLNAQPTETLPKFELDSCIIVGQLQTDLVKIQNIMKEFIALSSFQKESHEVCWSICNQLTPIIRSLCECLKCEENTSENSLVRKFESINFYAQEISTFYGRNFKEPPEKDEMKILMKNEEIVENEGNLIYYRIAFVTIAMMAKESSKFCELITTPNDSILDLLSDLILDCIFPAQKLPRYMGCTKALAILALNISRHYKNFHQNEVEKHSLKDFIRGVILMSFNNIEILMNLTNTLINIAQVDDSKFLIQMCRNVPSKSFRKNKFFQIIKFPSTSCEIQILFMLLLNAFPSLKEVNQERLKLLFKLTQNVNILAYLFLMQGCNMRCLQSYRKFVSDESCRCLYSVIISVTKLNKIVIDLRYKSLEHFKRIRHAIHCFLTSALNFLPYIKHAPPFMNMKSLHLDLMQAFHLCSSGKFNFNHFFS